MQQCRRFDAALSNRTALNKAENIHAPAILKATSIAVTKPPELWFALSPLRLSLDHGGFVLTGYAEVIPRDLIDAITCGFPDYPC
jgi:hypothetical protein